MVVFSGGAAPVCDFSELLTAAQCGDRAALGVLFRRVQRCLLRDARDWLGRGLRGKCGAHDVVQETFLDAQSHLADFRGETERQFLTWLRRSLRRNLVSARRYYAEALKRSVTRERGIELACECPDPQPGPSEGVQRDELDDAVRRALDGLPARYAEVVRCKYERRAGYGEVGRATGTSAEAARKAHDRAVRLLRRALREWA